MTDLIVFLFIGGLFRVIFAIIWFLLLAVTLLDLFKSSLPLNTKLLWLIVILIAPVLGSLVYFFWGRYQKSI